MAKLRFYTFLFGLAFSVNGFSSQSLESKVTDFITQYYQLVKKAEDKALYNYYKNNAEIRYELDYGFFYPTEKLQYSRDEFFAEDESDDSYTVLSIKSDQPKIGIDGNNINVAVKLEEHFQYESIKAKSRGEDFFKLELDKDQLVIIKQLSKRSF